MATALAFSFAGSADAAPKKDFKLAWSIYVGWMPWQWAAEQGIVVVAVNYRLGALGFLRAPGVCEGNLGLLDQEAALAWVRQHIEAFGGDPSQVAVMGQSAGGISIAHHLARPSWWARRAIIMSGPLSLDPQPVESAERTGAVFLRALGIDDPSAPDALARAQAAARVAVEILVEQQQVAEMRVRLHLLAPTEDRPAPVRISQEQADQPLAQMVRDLVQRHLLVGAGRAFDREVRAVIAVEAAQALDQQVVHRHPDRPAPVGVAAEHPGIRLRRLVLHPVAHAIERDLERAVPIHLRQGAHAVRGEELRLVQHPLQQLGHAVDAGQRQQVPPVRAGVVPAGDEGREVAPLLPQEA
ncbi:MAG: carboxylesterase family protein [Rhodospirillales bacterium]|nr:carboxylesterase family protein [Rhodospirillales bacterium]